jgi:hypothetical protein
MYAPSVDSRGITYFARNENIQVLKDFSIRPRPRAVRLALDCSKTAIFDNALAIDSAMRAVAQGTAEPVDSFSPPEVMLAFPMTYKPRVEWCQAMCDAVIDVFQPDAPILGCLRSPGGILRGVKEQDGFRTYTFDTNGMTTYKSVPVWTTRRTTCNIGDVCEEGERLSDLPRVAYTKIGQIREMYALAAIQWIEQAILDDITECIQIEERGYDRDTNELMVSEKNWKVVPISFVRKQMGRSARCYLNMRDHTGRLVVDGSNIEFDHTLPRIDVCRFDNYPTREDFVFHAKDNWYADFSQLHMQYNDVNERFQLRCRQAA